jgi:hypothetical protein
MKNWIKAHPAWTAAIIFVALVVIGILGNHGLAD